MNEKNDRKLERLLWDIFFKPSSFGKKDVDLLMQTWNVLEDSRPEDILDARARFVRTFRVG